MAVLPSLEGECVDCASCESSTLAAEVLLHEGWCVKESGGAFLGRTNWRRRWFRLVQRKDSAVLQYFRCGCTQQLRLLYATMKHPIQ